MVYLDGDSSRLSTPAAHPNSHRCGSIAQRDARFVAYVTAVVQRGMIDFPNDYDVDHKPLPLEAAAVDSGNTHRH